MDAVTYPNAKVIDFITEKLIPLQLKSNAEPYASNYRIKWTPSLLVIDADGVEHFRITGFLPAVELIPSLVLGIGKANFDKDQFKEALECFDRVIAEYPYSSSAPEAVFFQGVAGYKSTHQPWHLKDAYNQLQARYHYSEWARKAYPYWLLP
jgi:tetratricopeptide (TPR) repeat protein